MEGGDIFLVRRSSKLSITTGELNCSAAFGMCELNIGESQAGCKDQPWQYTSCLGRAVSSDTIILFTYTNPFSSTIYIPLSLSPVSSLVILISNHSQAISFIYWYCINKTHDPSLKLLVFPWKWTAPLLHLPFVRARTSPVSRLYIVWALPTAMASFSSCTPSTM